MKENWFINTVIIFSICFSFCCGMHLIRLVEYANTFMQWLQGLFCIILMLFVSFCMGKLAVNLGIDNVSKGER